MGNEAGKNEPPVRFILFSFSFIFAIIIIFIFILFLLDQNELQYLVIIQHNST